MFSVSLYFSFWPLYPRIMTMRLKYIHKRIGQWLWTIPSLAHVLIIPLSNSEFCLIADSQLHMTTFLCVCLSPRIIFSLSLCVSLCWIFHLLILPQLTGQQLFIDRLCFHTGHSKLLSIVNFCYEVCTALHLG